MGNFWDRISAFYDIFQLTNRSVLRQMTEAAVSVVPEKGYVLDCAAGTGMFSVAAAKKAAHVVCTDYSKEMLVRCMKKARENNIKNISFARRDIISLKDEDGKYDAVIAANVLHLVDEPEKAIAELIRVTKQGGVIILPTFLQGEATFYRILLALYRAVGFAPKKCFTIEGYMALIKRAAEENGCAEYSTRFMHGALPGGFAVITKR